MPSTINQRKDWIRIELEAARTEFCINPELVHAAAQPSECDRPTHRSADLSARGPGSTT